VGELFTLVQEVIKRELTLAGKLISTTPAVLVAHG
jgi:hypothetical protein